MAHQKQYIVDTNVLLEDPQAVFKLRNGNENSVYIPYHVLLELDKLKKNSKLAHIVARVIKYLIDHPQHYKVLNSVDIAPLFSKTVDRHILDEIQKSGLDQPILVTNDKIFQLQLNPKLFEILPLAFIRGMNIENAVVIVDEMQNMTRAECRALLSRLGEGVKCICLGDIHQVDNIYLNQENNGLNWIVRKFKGSKIYSHIVLKGERSRGPITDLVISTGL
jgi:predicted ribonuclease YlaK